ncbi:MAG: hypothetical protein H5U37_03260 [Caldisericia bacterium]|nr:hypothetical protein [Caldisericia bacterium]
MIKKKFLNFFIIFILSLIPFTVVRAGVYMGGYLNRSISNYAKVLVVINYQNTLPTQIPSGNYLGGVLSVAGSNNLSPTGWIFQNPVALYNNGKINWYPQAWYGNELRYGTTFPEIGLYNYPAFYERIQITSSNITYKLYVYYNFQSIEHDSPIIYTWSHSKQNNNSLLVGKQIYNGRTYKHLQFGVESPSIITTSWELLNDNPCYFDGIGWRYDEGRVCYGTSSYITWIGNTPYTVGGQTYTGVNIFYSYDDCVCWKRTGTTIGDDSQLWSKSEVVSDIVNKPYEP